MGILAIPPPSHLTAAPSGDQGSKTIAIVSTFSALAAISVALRIASRKIKKVEWLASDYTIMVGLLGSWVVCGIVIAEVHFGVGKHIEEVITGKGNLTRLLQFTYAAQISYTFTISIIKISILLLYRSIFPGRRFASIIYLAGAPVIAWGLCFGFLAIFLCIPITRNWDPNVPATCINGNAVVMASGISNILIDVLILCLAVPKVWSLQMTLRLKLVVLGIFLTGGFVIIASIVRISTVRLIDSSDITYSSYGIAIWSAIEISMAVISACLPTLRPVFEHIMPKSLTFSFRNTMPFRTPHSSDQLGSDVAQILDTESLRRLQSDQLPSNHLPKQAVTRN